MDKEKKQLIVFGYGIAIILGLISVHLWRHNGWQSAHVILGPLIVTFILITSAKYRALKRLYQRWMKVAHFIGSIITGIILSLLFYFVFGVVGIILRLLGKDLIDRKINRQANSYWISKDQMAFDKSNYTRQF